MDPLSLTASIIAVVGLASKTSKALRRLYDLRYAPREILELTNEVSELQALLSLIQKATDNVAQDALSPGDLDFIERLIKNAQEPLKQLNALIEACSSGSETSNGDGDKSSSRLKVSFGTWLKSKNSIGKIRERFLRAHQNINTALGVLNSIHRQADYKVIVNVHDLVLNQIQAIEDGISSTLSGTVQELERKVSRAVSCSANKEKSGETFTEPNSPHCSGQLEATRSEFSVSATISTLTPQSSERNLDANRSSSDDPNRLDCHATIRASVGKGTCYRSCPCQCHPRKNIESPRWLADLLGNFFYSYTGTALLQMRPCNFTGCQQRKTVSCQLTYYCPLWMMKRMITVTFTACLQDLGGLSGSWSVGFPRAISATHDVWRFVEQGQYESIVQILREGTIMVNDTADDDGTSLLLFALKFRRNDVVELLLDHGANPHLVDPRGVSACAYAQSSILIDRPSQKPSWSAKMDISLAEMAITDDLRFTPLHHVVMGLEKADLYQQLRLNNGCINTLDSLGRSPLHWAVIQGNTSAVEVLLTHGAYPNSIDKEQMSPLHDVCQAPQSSQVGCARLLIDAGADVDARDSWGRTAFRIAVAFTSTSLDFIELLIKEGASVNVKDVYDQTPLLKSIRTNASTTQLLLKHGAGTEARDVYGNTALSEAIFRNRTEQLKLLLEYGAKTNQLLDIQPNRRAREGDVNILHFTAWYGNIEVMRALEGSEQHFCLSPRPIDDFEQHRELRLANGLGAGKEDHEAFVRLLSTVTYSLKESPYFNESEGGDSDEEETFTDAEEFP